MNRRNFLFRSALATGFVATGHLSPLLAETASTRAPRLTVLHTNDWHSRIDPFPEGAGRNAGQGGAARRAALIARIRQEAPNVILLDSGDIFQGTPYFNFFAGELEMKLMSQMGYDAATIGNHDFDGGIENLAKQAKTANFPLLSANYNVRGTPLERLVEPFKIFDYPQGMRVGVFGLGIELKGLVPTELYGGVAYLDPVERANATARLLREKYRCRLIICLSHLGYRYRDDKVSDVALAGQTTNIDLILGGHTHTFLDTAVEVPNFNGDAVIVNQVGFGGLRLGRLDVSFLRNNKITCIGCSNMTV